MFTLPKPALPLIQPSHALLLAAGLVQLGACAAVTRQVAVPDILAQPPAPAARSATLPKPVVEIAPAPTAPTAEVAPAPAADFTPKRHDVFVDQFESVEPQRWYVHDRGPSGAYTVNDFRPSQVARSPDGLLVTMQKNERGASSPYSSADISAIEGRTSGYIEVRVKAAKGSGVNTGVFTYGRSGGNDTWNEIDFEILGKNTNLVELTLHVGGKTVNKRHTLGFDSSKSFHTYGIAWEKGRVRWFIDNKLVHEVKGGIANGLVREQWLHINLWGTEELWQWMGRMDPSRTTWTAEIACAAMADSYEGKSLCAAPSVSAPTPSAMREPTPAAPARPTIVQDAPAAPIVAPAAAPPAASVESAPRTPAGTPLVTLTPSVAPTVAAPPAASTDGGADDRLEGSPSRP
jgi:endo-1,3-1,4-beta-glycanase ExoK